VLTHSNSASTNTSCSIRLFLSRGTDVSFTSLTKIERQIENLHLFSKLVAIKKVKGSVPSTQQVQNTQKQRLVQRARRDKIFQSQQRRKQEAIQQENDRLSRRLVEKHSMYNVNQWESHHQYHEQLLQNMGSYPVFRRGNSNKSLAHSPSQTSERYSLDRFDQQSHGRLQRKVSKSHLNNSMVIKTETARMRKSSSRVGLSN
jgi:hypothetical protein